MTMTMRSLVTITIAILCASGAHSIHFETGLTQLSDSDLMTISGLQLYSYPYFSPDPCLYEALQSCQAMFNRALNITSNADWTDPLEFGNQIFIRLQMGVNDGLLPLCSAWQVLYSCLGTTYYNCFNPTYLISQGFPITASFQFSGEILQTQFRCVGGIEQSVKHYSCIMTVLQNQAGIMDCFNTYNATIGGGDFSNFCQAAQNYSICVSNLFAACQPDVRWWACETIRIGFSLSGCPEARCTVPPPAPPTPPPMLEGYHDPRDAIDKDGNFSPQQMNSINSRYGFLAMMFNRHDASN